MKKIALAFWLALASPAFAANVDIPALPAASSVAGTDLFECSQSGVSDKCTAAQFATYLASLTQTLTNKSISGAQVNSGTVPAAQMPAFTGDCTTSAGAVATTCTKTSGTNFGALATATPGTGVSTAAAANLSAAGGLASTIASGTSAMGTSAISSAACATVVTTAATNTATTDVVTASFNGDPTAVTGYIPATAGMLTIFAYPTSGNVNFKVCNNTASSITPGAITLNWRVVR